MRTYIYWPNGLLTIKEGGRTIYDNGHKAKGEVLFGEPLPSDKVERPQLPIVE